MSEDERTDPASSSHEFGDHPDNAVSRDRDLKSDSQSGLIRLPLRILLKDTHDYLMSLFWTNYNSAFEILNKNAFEEGYHQKDSQYYSVFLHLCVLAIGYRFSDKSRMDIQVLSAGRSESILHRDAKCIVYHQLDHLCDLPSVVALLILGDLECGAGRETNAWLYGKAALR